MTAHTNHKKVREFFDKFGVPRGLSPQILDDDTFLFRYGHMLEELVEMGQAHRTRDLEKFADAIVDLLYLAYGTGVSAGLPMDDLFDAVHEANMQKVRAQSESDSKRSSKIDVVKPPGWAPADLSRFLTSRSDQTDYKPDPSFVLINGATDAKI